MNSLLEVIAGILGCAAHLYTPKCCFIRSFLLFINCALSVFDCYSDWKVWQVISDKGFNHPLLQFPQSWSKAWLTFTILGTVTTSLSIINEFTAIIFFSRQCTNHHRSSVSSDICCFPCSRCGINYVTRCEILALLNLLLEDIPLMVFTLLFAATKYSCNLPFPVSSSALLLPVFVSSLASVADVGWCFVRGIFRCTMRVVSHRNEEMEAAEANEMYPKQYSLVVCFVCHTLLMMLFYFIAILLSLAAVITAAVFLSHSEASSLTDPNKELLIYRTFPENHVLSNASAVILDEGHTTCINETFVQSDNISITCTLGLQYNPEERKIEYNFEQHTERNTADPNAKESKRRCTTYYSDLVLGHTVDSGGLKKFDDTCLGVLILPENEEPLLRNEKLSVIC